MIEPFDFLYLDGQDLYLRIYNAAGQVFDFDDNTFKALSGATTPYAAMTEQTDVGGSGESGYLVNIDLDDVNATTTPLPIRWMVFNNANPQSSDRGVSAMMSDTVISGKLLVEATAVVSGLGTGALGQITAGGVNVSFPGPINGVIRLVIGGDYSQATGNAIPFANASGAGWPEDLTGYDIEWRVDGMAPIEGEVVSPVAPHSIVCEVDKAITLQQLRGVKEYQVWAVQGSVEALLAEGEVRFFTKI